MSLQELTRTAHGIIDLDELVARFEGSVGDREYALLDLAKRNNHLYEHYMRLEAKVNEVLNAKPIPHNFDWSAGLFYAQAILSREDDDIPTALTDADRAEADATIAGGG